MLLSSSFAILFWLVFVSVFISSNSSEDEDKHRMIFSDLLQEQQIPAEAEAIRQKQMLEEEEEKKTNKMRFLSTQPPNPIALGFITYTKYAKPQSVGANPCQPGQEILYKAVATGVCYLSSLLGGLHGSKSFQFQGLQNHDNSNATNNQLFYINSLCSGDPFLISTLWRYTGCVLSNTGQYVNSKYVPFVQGDPFPSATFTGYVISFYSNLGPCLPNSIASFLISKSNACINKVDGTSFFTYAFSAYYVQNYYRAPDCLNSSYSGGGTSSSYEGCLSYKFSNTQGL